MIQHDDTQIIHNILAGNTRDFEILVNRHKALAFTIAYRLLNNREDAEEATQDAFIKAFRALAGFRKESVFSTWLYRIVYNTAISMKRTRKSIFQNIEDIPDINENPDIPKYDFDAIAERNRIFERAMSRIPEDERVLITLYYLNESGIDEIHEITGLSKSNVKVKLFRARKKLQELVSKMTETMYI